MFLLLATFVVYKITKDFMKKQILGLLWSIFVMASVMFVFSFIFALLDAVIKVFFLDV